VLHSKAKGTIGEVKVAADLLSRGFHVFTEIGDLSKIDLIAERDRKLYRFQVKAYHSKDGVVVLSSKKSGPNYSFHYESDQIDIFAVYVLDKDIIFYVSSKEVCEYSSSMNIRLEPPKNGQKKNINLAENYTLERILRDYTPNTQTDNAVGDDIVQTSKPFLGGLGN
jgi:hypothetical protein